MLRAPTSSRVLPAPGSPAMSTADGRPARNASEMTSISASRPTRRAAGDPLAGRPVTARPAYVWSDGGGEDPNWRRPRPRQRRGGPPGRRRAARGRGRGLAVAVRAGVLVAGGAVRRDGVRAGADDAPQGGHRRGDPARPPP